MATVNIDMDEFIRVEEGKFLWWQGEEVLVRLVSGMETNITFNVLGGVIESSQGNSVKVLQCV